MLSSADIFFCALLPLFISAILLSLFRRRAWSASLALGAAFVCALVFIEKMIDFTSAGVRFAFAPNSAPIWLFYSAIVFGIFVLLVALFHWSSRVMAVGLFVFVAAANGVMLRFNFVQGVWSPLSGAAVLATIAIVAVIVSLSFQPYKADDAIVSSLAMSMVAGLGGLSVMMLADQTIGEGMAALGVAVLPLVIRAIFAKGRGNTIAGRAGAATVFASITVTALACAVYVSDVPRSDALLVAGAPVLFWLTHFLPRGRIRAWQRGLIRLLITAVPLGIVMGLAVRALQQERAEAYSMIVPMSPAF